MAIEKTTYWCNVSPSGKALVFTIDGKKYTAAISQIKRLIDGNIQGLNLGVITVDTPNGV